MGPTSLKTSPLLGAAFVRKRIEALFRKLQENAKATKIKVR
jgi:hypothetical protein